MKKRFRLQNSHVFIFVAMVATWVISFRVVLPHSQNETILSTFTQESPRAERRLERVVRLAHEKGFEFDAPRIQKVNFLFMTTSLGMLNLRSNRIMINSLWIALLNDEELDFLIAHELGHSIDYQSGRIDHRAWRREAYSRPAHAHPFFEHADTLNAQAFADAFAIWVLERTTRGRLPDYTN